MDSDGLYNDRDLAQFYDLENGWRDDLEYCRRLAVDALSVLDLGCGTGLFAATLAQESERRVVGVDPAGPMLEIARARPGGDRVCLIEDDARSVRLGERFDLIVLTGHAFQVFLTEDDRAAVLATIARHLSPAGRFIFDTRNPIAKEWLTWTPEASRRMIRHPALGEVQAWNDAAHDPATDIVTYGTFYEVRSGNRLYSSSSRIAFSTQESLVVLLRDAGLAVDNWFGDWTGAPFSAGANEIIPLGRLEAQRA